jgi:hypothetical protein
LLKHWEFYTTPKPALVQKSFRINVRNPVALETWTVRENDKRRLTSFEMKFLRRAAGHTRVDQRKNLEIGVKVEAEPVDGKLRRYKSD